jgi:hypothetical protein
MSINSNRYVGRAAPKTRPAPPHTSAPSPPRTFVPPPLPPEQDHPRRTGLHRLLLIPVVIPLLTPLYNRLSPHLLGLPFFYWFPIAFVFVDVGVITLVYHLTKRRP